MFWLETIYGSNYFLQFHMNLVFEQNNSLTSNLQQKKGFFKGKDFKTKGF